MERIGVSALGEPESSHTHSYTNPRLLHEVTIEETVNYCRTPDGGDWPWCFPTPPEVRSQACGFDVKLCGGGLTSGTQIWPSIISNYVQNLILALIYRCYSFKPADVKLSTEEFICSHMTWLHKIQHSKIIPFRLLPAGLCLRLPGKYKLYRQWNSMSTMGPSNPPSPLLYQYRFPEDTLEEVGSSWWLNGMSVLLHGYIKPVIRVFGCFYCYYFWILKRSSVKSLLAVGPWCFGYHVNGKLYQGHVGETATGKPCQRWDAQHPHRHIYSVFWYLLTLCILYTSIRGLSNTAPSHCVWWPSSALVMPSQ